MLKKAISSIGFNGDLLQAYEAFQKAVRDEVWRQVARLQNPHAGAVQAIQEKVRNNFKFLKFFCKGILEKHALNYYKVVAE